MSKIEKIKAELARLKEETSIGLSEHENGVEQGRMEIINALSNFLYSLQEEPIKIKKGCKYRCLSDMVNRDTGKISFIGGKIYLAPKDDTLVSEENGWLCDTSENASNFELVEESKCSVWHDMSEDAENGRNIIIIDPKDFYGAVLRKGGSQLKNHNKERYVKWAYIDDVVNLSNIERTTKDWKELTEFEKEVGIVCRSLLLSNVTPVGYETENVAKRLLSLARKQIANDVVKQYADKGDFLYGESTDDFPNDMYWDGFRDCANGIKRELED